MGDLPLGLSFDDVLLLPRKSAILPAEADLSTRLTGAIGLNIPIVSSAMDTVTEAELAIALAREGGIGVVHRNMPIPDQAEMVAKVKRSENMVIQDPFTVMPETTLETLQQIMREKGVNGFPVVDLNGNLAGMVTTRDIWMIENPAGKVSEVMTPRDRLTSSWSGFSAESPAKVSSLPRLTGWLMPGRVTGANVDGRVVVVGGEGAAGASAAVDLYDPPAGWSD